MFKIKRKHRHLGFFPQCNTIVTKVTHKIFSKIRARKRQLCQAQSNISFAALNLLALGQCITCMYSSSTLSSTPVLCDKRHICTEMASTHSRFKCFLLFSGSFIFMSHRTAMLENVKVGLDLWKSQTRLRRNVLHTLAHFLSFAQPHKFNYLTPAFTNVALKITKLKMHINLF